MKKKKYNCEKCEDIGYSMNPFDEQIKCDCKMKKYPKADYRGFVLHIWEWIDSDIPFGMSDLRELAKTYNCPVPKEYR